MPCAQAAEPALGAPHQRSPRDSAGSRALRAAEPAEPEDVATPAREIAGPVQSGLRGPPSLHNTDDHGRQAHGMISVAVRSGKPGSPSLHDNNDHDNLAR